MSANVATLKNNLGVAAAFTSAATGTWTKAPAEVCTFQTAQTGAGSCIVEIHGSNDRSVTPGAGTLLCTLTTASNGDTATQSKDSAAYRYKLAKPTTMTATNVLVLMGSA
jgi:hypothetical protein